MKDTEIHIRETAVTDFQDIMKVEEQAFGYDKEAKLTADLLKDKTAKPILSLLAFHSQKAIGHILFTRVYMNEMDNNQPLLHILAPLAIIPEYQKKGVGGLLIQHGLETLKEIGSEMVFVLGHPTYYPKYGFIPDAMQKGYTAPFTIPEKVKNAWMVQSLNSAGFVIPAGQIVCADALNKLEHWQE